MHFDIEQILSQMTLEEKAQFCSGQDFWYSQAIPRLGIPPVMMCDGPNGLRKQLGEGDHLGINESIETVCYPTSSAMASSFDENLMERWGHLLGQECQAEHVGMLLGPGINMKRSPLCGRNFEYMSEDPYHAGKMAAAYVRGLQSEGVYACVKHFAANNQEHMRMSGSSHLDERTLHEIYFPAFEAAVKEGGAKSVMCAYNGINGTFCSENKMLLTDVLREKWGFDGFVVTDWGASKDRAKGLQAGVDLEMPGSTTGKAEPILEAIKDGSLSEETLDAAVRNLLQFVKFHLEQKQENGCFNRELAYKEATAFAKESAVLLKNDHILPLNRQQKIAVIGPFAKKPRYQGAGSSHVNAPRVSAALEHLEGIDYIYCQGYEVHSDGVQQDLIDEAVSAAVNAEVAVIFAGLPEAYETEGADRDHMAMPTNQNALIEAVAAAQPNTVVVLHTGSCVEMPWLNMVKGVLCMYLGGCGVGEATVSLLFGDHSPSGHLAETWPVQVEDNPSYLNFPGEKGQVEYHEGIYIGYRYYDKKNMQVLFPFGHGLSYTHFAYSDLKLSSDRITDSDTLTVTCKVKNIGTVAAKAVPQLYVGCEKSEVRRPIRQLQGFTKIQLKPGEEKEVCFRLSMRDFAYYEVKIHDWFVESGAYTIEIGDSSRDIRLSASVQMQSFMELPFTYTANSTFGDLLRTARGREVFGQITRLIAQRKGQTQTDNNALGEGSQRMENAMFLGMPIGAAHTYGMISAQQLHQMLQTLNP